MSNMRAERGLWGWGFHWVWATLGYFLWVRAGLRIEVGSGSAMDEWSRIVGKGILRIKLAKFEG